MSPPAPWGSVWPTSTTARSGRALIDSSASIDIAHAAPTAARVAIRATSHFAIICFFNFSAASLLNLHGMDADWGSSSDEEESALRKEREDAKRKETAVRGLRV